ncbi:MAG: 4Fe-4S dicluster domain-containing protein [Thermodesulfobacterium sp.]|nr:4Fe-4S dicluster domain-containing protein [Thermodesulfobacterium sp.]
MAIKRRDFLKLTGLTLVGTAASAAVGDLLTRGEVKAQEYATPPEALKGKRWAMVIDVKKCKEGQKKGCGKKCIEVCHYLHNVPSIPDKKKEIKWIWEDEFEHAFPEQTDEYLEEIFKDVPFMLLCNQCDNPPCVRVCPTKATFKREDGIVMMDFHRCIGCRFCMAACPYGSRSFNWFDPRKYLKKVNPEYPTRTKGVVEKCLFCYERLAQGKLPACVEACPEKALIFGDLADENSEVSKILKERVALRRKAELGTGPAVFYLID